LSNNINRFSNLLLIAFMLGFDMHLILLLVYGLRVILALHDMLENDLNVILYLEPIDILILNLLKVFYQPIDRIFPGSFVVQFD
jgi:hypothetical protein